MEQCLKIFERFAGEHNPCNDLPKDISKCSENIKALVGFEDLARNVCTDFASNAYSPIAEFRCDEDVLDKEVCLGIEELTRTVKGALEAYKRQRNDEGFDNTLKEAQDKCAGGSGINSLVCGEAGKFAGKFGKAFADIKPEQPDKRKLKNWEIALIAVSSILVVGGAVTGIAIGAKRHCECCTGSNVLRM